MLPPFRHSDVTSPGLERAVVRDGRRARARTRRWLSRALLLLPGLLVVACDLFLTHGSALAGSHERAVAYAEAAACTVVLWGAVLTLASARRYPWRAFGLSLLLLLAFVAVGGQLYTFSRYQAFLDTDAMLVGTAMLPSVRQQLWFDQLHFVRSVLPPVVLAIVLAGVQRRVAPPRGRAAKVAADAAVITLFLLAFYAPHDDDRDAGTFDARYIHGLGQLGRAVWDKNPLLARAHPGPRSPEPVPPLTARPARARNVVFVLTESVRAASVCVDYDPDCRTTPFSNAAAPSRIALRGMRSVDSTTAISLGVMWSGISPASSRQALHSAPLVWEYASAAGLDTAYWTSQHLLFGNSGAWLQGIAFGHFASATQIEADPDLETGADDGALVSHVDTELVTLREPFLAVVHLSNTHMPYAIDESDAPFQPQGPESWHGHEEEIKNRYADAIWHQDRAVARLINAVHASPVAPRTVIVFLSDHGEQLYEKGAFGHTGTLFEPEVLIPAWVEAPPGTLSPAEETHLRALHDAPITTMDVLPTLLDLVGVWDDPGIATFRRAIPGASLLRGGSLPGTPFVMTNCTELWACAFKNWGAIAGHRKLFAMQGGGSWMCFDTQDDPEEQLDRGVSECADLLPIAQGGGRGTPF